MTHPVHRDPYRFLVGQSVDDIELEPPGNWALMEYRFYRWKDAWEVVAVQAELPAAGMVEGKGIGARQTR